MISTAYYVTRSAGESVFILILNLMLRNINVQSIRALNLLIFNSVVIECVLLSLLQSIRALNLLIFTSVVIECALLSLLQSIRALNLLIFTSVVIECVLLSLLQSIRSLNVLIFTSVVIVWNVYCYLCYRVLER